MAPVFLEKDTGPGCWTESQLAHRARHPDEAGVPMHLITAEATLLLFAFRATCAYISSATRSSWALAKLAKMPKP